MLKDLKTNLFKYPMYSLKEYTHNTYHWVSLVNVTGSELMFGKKSSYQWYKTTIRNLNNEIRISNKHGKLDEEK